MNTEQGVKQEQHVGISEFFGSVRALYEVLEPLASVGVHLVDEVGTFQRCSGTFKTERRDVINSQSIALIQQ